MPPRIDWHQKAREHGFAGPHTMLYVMYEKSHLSAQAIALRLGVSTTAVYSKLKALGIQVRPPSSGKGEWSKTMRRHFV